MAIGQGGRGGSQGFSHKYLAVFLVELQLETHVKLCEELRANPNNVGAAKDGRNNKTL